MFERTKASISGNGNRIKSISVKVKVRTPNKGGSWGIADIQFQEGGVATEYTEHVAEMERIKGNRE